MKRTHWSPFIIFGLIIGGILLIALGLLGLIFFSSGNFDPGIAYEGGWPGMWGLGPAGMAFPCFGFVMILFMVFFFFRMMTGGGPMSRLMSRGGPMSGMMGYHRDSQSQSQASRDKP